MEMHYRTIHLISSYFILSRKCTNFSNTTVVVVFLLRQETIQNYCGKRLVLSTPSKGPDLQILLNTIWKQNIRSSLWFPSCEKNIYIVHGNKLVVNLIDLGKRENDVFWVHQLNTRIKIITPYRNYRSYPDAHCCFCFEEKSTAGLTTLKISPASWTVIYIVFWLPLLRQ